MVDGQVCVAKVIETRPDPGNRLTHRILYLSGGSGARTRWVCLDKKRMVLHYDNHTNIKYTEVAKGDEHDKSDDEIQMPVAQPKVAQTDVKNGGGYTTAASFAREAEAEENLPELDDLLDELLHAAHASR